MKPRVAPRRLLAELTSSPDVAALDVRLSADELSRHAHGALQEPRSE